MPEPSPEPPVAEQVPSRAHPPRRHVRRRLRVAARQGVARTRSPTSRPRTPTPRRAPPTWPALREHDLRGDQGAHPGDRPVGAGRGSAATGTTAAPSRASSTASAAAARGRPRRLGPAAARRRRRRPRASRCCSTATSSPRATTSSRSAPLASAPTAACSRSAPTPPATSGSCCRSRTCAPASCSPTRSPTRRTAPPGTSRGTHLFYTTVDDAWRPDKVWRHRLGTDRSDDVVVHHEADERFWVSVGRTRSDRYLVIGVGSKITSEYRILDADDPTGEFRVVAPRRQGVEYGVEHAVIGGEDRAPGAAQRRRRELRAGQAPVDATSARAVGAGDRRTTRPCASRTSTRSPSHLVVSQRSDGLTQLRVLAPRRGRPRTDELLVEFGAPDLHRGRGRQPGVPPADDPVRLHHDGHARLGATDSTCAPASGRCSSRPRSSAASTPTPTSSTASGRPPRTAPRCRSRSWCPKGTPRDGTTPFLLYGYGSYETSMDPYFSISRLSLLDRGVVFAIAHVRGGGEMGRHWYDDGKMLHKRTPSPTSSPAPGTSPTPAGPRPDRLVAEGGSAGGLLMGAVANLAPEAFAGSWPTCRSSTRSPRSSTRRCR